MPRYICLKKLQEQRWKLQDYEISCYLLANSAFIGSSMGSVLLIHPVVDITKYVYHDVECLSHCRKYINSKLQSLS